MSSYLPRSVVGAEDARFCVHHGVDWDALREVVDDAEDGEVTRGGSTITQQVAKNLFLWPGRSVVRKALELPLALWIDAVLPKRRILELYLNIAELGPSGQFGAEAGANHAFGKSAAALSPREAALMAAILPNPVKRSARAPGPGVAAACGDLYGTRGVAGAADLLGWPMSLREFWLQLPQSGLAMPALIPYKRGLDRHPGSPASNGCSRPLRTMPCKSP